MIFLIIFLVLWSIAGAVSMCCRYMTNKYGNFWKDFLCHIIEGPISWVVFIIIFVVFIVGNIADFMYKEKK